MCCLFDTSIILHKYTDYNDSKFKTLFCIQNARGQKYC